LFFTNIITATAHVAIQKCGFTFQQLGHSLLLPSKDEG